MISAWSLLCGILWFSVAMILLHLLRRHTDFLMRYGTFVLLVTVALACVRILIPFDSGFAVIIRSDQLLSTLNQTLRGPVFRACSMGDLLIGVWILGATVTLALTLWRTIRDVQMIHAYPAVESEQAQRVAAQIGLAPDRIMVTSAVETPLSVGLISPKIFLPAISCSDTDLLWVLRHEMTHIRQKHIWFKLLYRLLRCVFWWNPIMHWLQKDVDDIFELCCDCAVLKDSTEEERYEYVETLYRMAKQVTGTSAFASSSVMTFIPSTNANVLVQRAHLAFQHPAPSKKREALTLLVGLLLFAASYLVIFQPASFPPESEIGNDETIMITPQNSYLVQTDPDEYEVWCYGVYWCKINNDLASMPPYNSLEVKK